jgi:(1->4)-alpha-D-glucan 1-alpha-D-glucosylmutase
LIEENTVQGLRIDHIDGLYDPAGYLDRIRKKNPEMYVTVEKILAFDEELPAHWPVQGTTGYDFLNRVNGIFCDPLNETRFNQIYARFAGPQKPYSDLVSEKKRLIIGKYMAGDVDALAHLLKTISSRDRYGSDITLYGLRRALVEVLTFFPVYRSYVSPQIYDTADRQHIQESVRKAREANPGLLHELNFIERFLLLNVGAHTAAEDKHQWIHFVMRFQQLTGPLMAKGFEDTLLYVYNRLLSLNEVGGDPGQFGGGIDQFHAFNGNRARRWPHAMNATSTHDTKRGEDARARINVLSEQPDEWEKTLRLWSKINAPARPVLRGQAVPDRNDEYFFYQTLIGAFPLQTEQSRDFLERLKAYIVKSVREAKVHTEWLKPDQAYENAFVAFIDKILCASESNRFLGEFLPFARKVAYHGMLNSLSQTLLKIFSPGVPDFYQGSELWDLNFVDPDNRRPVDFSRRAEMLGNLRRQEAGCLGLASQLLAQWEDGQVKLFVIYKALRFRRAYKELFLDGDYLPLYAKGPAQEHICAFARHKQGQWSLVTVPRLTTKLTTPENPPVGAAIWNSTSIMLPQGAPDKWINILTGEELGPCRTGKDRGLLMDAVFHEFPLGLLAPVQ